MIIRLILLSSGDEFYLMEDNKLVCKADYEAAKQRGELIFFAIIKDISLFFIYLFIFNHLKNFFRSIFKKTKNNYNCQAIGNIKKCI